MITLEKGKSYRQSDGVVWEIVYVGLVGVKTCIGVQVADGVADLWREDGCYYSNGHSSSLDLIEEV